jgi:hypothetical protein
VLPLPPVRCCCCYHSLNYSLTSPPRYVEAEDEFDVLPAALAEAKRVADRLERDKQAALHDEVVDVDTVEPVAQYVDDGVPMPNGEIFHLPLPPLFSKYHAGGAASGARAAASNSPPPWNGGQGVKRKAVL